MDKIADAFSLIRNGANIKQGLDDSGYPITRIETISNRTVDRDKMGYAGITDITKYSDYVLQDGDILMSHINSETHLGKVARYEKYEGETIIHGMNLLCLRPNKNLVDSRYAFYYLSSEAFLHQIPRITKKSVNQASFNVAALKELTFPISSMEVQQPVADILDKANELIALRKEQLAKLDELVKARFIELFGDPVYNSKRLPIQRLCKLGSLDRGRSQHRPRNDPKLLNGPYPLIQTGEVASAGLYITKYKNTYSELGLRQSKMWSAGTLCITIAANIAQTAILTFDACFPDSVVGFLPNDSINAIYMHYWFGFFQKILEKQAPQVAQKNINLKILSELNVIVPTQEKQEQFAAFVEQTDKSKLAIEQSLGKLKTLRKSLMQEYYGQGE